MRVAPSNPEAMSFVHSVSHGSVHHGSSVRCSIPDTFPSRMDSRSSTFHSLTAGVTAYQPQDATLSSRPLVLPCTRMARTVPVTLTLSPEGTAVGPDAHFAPIPHSWPMSQSPAFRPLLQYTCQPLMSEPVCSRISS